jgi:hypothetical protein
MEIKRIIDLFEKKKTIIIPKTENITGEGNFTVNLNYQQKLFDRPKHLIVYSQKCNLEPTTKDYEATIHDMNFLKYEKNISLDDIERVITDLENDVNKGEMIPYDRIKEIIIRVLPDKKSQADRIAKVSIIYVHVLNYIYLDFIII